MSFWDNITNFFSLRLGHTTVAQSIATTAATAAINAVTEQLQKSASNGGIDAVLATVEGALANIIVGAITGAPKGATSATVPRLLAIRSEDPSPAEKVEAVHQITTRVAQNATALALAALAAKGDVDDQDLPSDVVAAVQQLRNDNGPTAA